MKKFLTLLALATILTGCGIEQVDEGYRGIKTVWGRVEGEPLTPGLYFYNPVSSGIFEILVREQKLEGSSTAFTRDTQTVTVELAVTYYPEAHKIGEIYSQFGKDWDDKIVSPAILGSLKDAIGRFIADDLVSKREEVRDYALREIQESLSTRGIIVTRLDITNLDFQQAYEEAVEAKVVAIQRAHEAKNQTVQIEEQAKQTVLQAQAEAESMKIRSAALSQNKSLVEYEAVQKWDGKLPQYILGGGSVPFIDLNKLGK
jgi:prohibitin 2